MINVIPCNRASHTPDIVRNIISLQRENRLIEGINRHVFRNRIPERVACVPERVVSQILRGIFVPPAETQTRRVVIGGFIVVDGAGRLDCLLTVCYFLRCDFSVMPPHIEGHGMGICFRDRDSDDCLDPYVCAPTCLCHCRIRLVDLFSAGYLQIGIKCGTSGRCGETVVAIAKAYICVVGLTRLEGRAGIKNLTPV